MKTLNTFRKIMLVCVILTLMFIWGNSLLPGDLSSQESGWVEDLLEPVLRYIGSGRIQAELYTLADRLPGSLGPLAARTVGWLDRHILSREPSFLVRKAAHLSEYMLLGFLMGLLFVRPDGRLRVFLPEGACLAAALIDEGIQLFSVQRAAQIRDVCIDMLGAIAGLACALLLMTLLLIVFRRRAPKSGKIS